MKKKTKPRKPVRKIKDDPKKKSANYDEVLQLMAEGWELGKSRSVTGMKPEYRIWLQKGGIGKGGDALSVRQQTLKSLLTTNKIEESSYSYRVVKYKLVPYANHKVSNTTLSGSSGKLDGPGIHCSPIVKS